MTDKFPMKNTAIEPDDHHARTQALKQIWAALHGYREDCIPEAMGDHWYDEEWQCICEAMDLVHSVMGIDQEDV